MISVGLKRRAFGFGLALISGAFNLRRRLGKTASAGGSAPVVLILEPFGMGDVISLEPLIRNLHERKFEIRLSAQPAWRQLYPEPSIATWIDSQVPWTSYDSTRKYRWSSFWTTSFRNYVIQLRRFGRGAIGIDPRGDLRSILLLHLAGVEGFSHWGAISAQTCACPASPLKLWITATT